jgi:hypothetical protein
LLSREPSGASVVEMFEVRRLYRASGCSANLQVRRLRRGIE